MLAETGMKLNLFIVRPKLLINLRHFCQKSAMNSLMVPPVSVRGMTNLERDLFTSKISVPCLKLGPTQLPEIIRILKKYLLKLKNFKPIRVNENHTVVYLDPRKVKVMSDMDLRDEVILREYVEELERVELTFKYENWQSDEIFRAILPENTEIPTSYSKIGHIVHLNLRDSQLPYKNIIGKVLLDNIPNARTVVNKLSVIDTTYRHFAMELLAGDQDTVAMVKENGLTYKFDFAKVYWNPRLSTEHAKLLEMMEEGDVLYDVFAGVGPFAVPAARKGLKVLANDLNPESYKWLRANATTNKVKNFQAFNKDGRDFLRDDVKNDISERREKKITGNEHIAMNLPAMACEFLDVLRDWFDESETEKLCDNPPVIHLYCFVKTEKDDDPKDLAKLLVEEKIGCSLTEESLKVIHHVRNVSPNKEMMRNTMGKSKKNVKTKNVFKVASRRRPASDLKGSSSSKANSMNKTRQDSIAKKNKEKIKRIDQQLQNLRPIVNAKVPLPKPQISNKTNESLKKPDRSNLRAEVVTPLVKNLQL